MFLNQMPSQSLRNCGLEAQEAEVEEAIRAAEGLLPGVPVDEGIDPRWQAIIQVEEFIGSEPEPVWLFIRKWGGHSDSDLRAAIATFLLEHLLEYHFEEYFEQVEQAALADQRFADTFCLCWPFGEAAEPKKAERFLALAVRLRKQNPV